MLSVCSLAAEVYRFRISAQEFGADFEVFITEVLSDGSNKIKSGKYGDSDVSELIRIERVPDIIELSYDLILSKTIENECQIWIKDSFASDAFSFSSGLSSTVINVFNEAEEFLEIRLYSTEKGYETWSKFNGADEDRSIYLSQGAKLWKICSIIPANEQISINNQLYKKTRIITGKVWNTHTGAPIARADIILNTKNIIQTDELGNYIIGYDYDKLEQIVFAEYKASRSQEVVFNSFDEYPQSIDLKIDYDPGPPPKENFRRSFYLHFAYDSAALAHSEENTNKIKEMLKVISGYQIIGAVKIEGHTDSRGNELYNYRLSYDRAKTVKNVLQKKTQGVSFELAGYGESRPAADNSTSEGRAQNRRVEVAFEYQADRD